MSTLSNEDTAATLEYHEATKHSERSLRASRHFLDLQRQLVTTEDRIQASRRLFNGNVRDYNRRVESIPSRLIGPSAKASPRSDESST